MQIFGFVRIITQEAISVTRMCIISEWLMLRSLYICSYNEYVIKQLILQLRKKSLVAAFNYVVGSCMHIVECQCMW